MRDAISGIVDNCLESLEQLNRTTTALRYTLTSAIFAEQSKEYLEMLQETWSQILKVNGDLTKARQVLATAGETD